MIKNNKNRKGFTLIELLVVIAIIAILAVVVILTLNPAELLRQARDSNRESDFATLKSAIGLYSADVATTTNLYGGVASDSLYTANPTATAASTTYEGAGTWGFGLLASGTNTYATNITTNTSRAVTGAGWIPINFTAISAGSPIGALPVDPVNSQSYMYIFAASSTGTYKLAAKTESYKYSFNGPNDIESTDGGQSTGTYEQGTNLAL